MTPTGRATIAGFAGGISFTGIGTLFKKGGTHKTTTKSVELRDDQDVLRGLNFTTGEEEFTLNVTPVAASGTNTLANARTSLAGRPDPGAQVTLADFDDSSVNHARWVYMGDWQATYDAGNLVSCSLTIKCSADSGIDLSYQD